MLDTIRPFSVESARYIVHLDRRNDDNEQT